MNEFDPQSCWKPSPIPGTRGEIVCPRHCGWAFHGYTIDEVTPLLEKHMDEHARLEDGTYVAGT